MALRVLLADESTTIKKVMQLALQDFAVEVKAVHVGLDVVEVARQFQPDIIFADVLLQKKNGYEVCGELKRDPGLKAIPVVLMWSSFMDLDEALAKDCGADRRLEKPFDIENLRQVLLDLVPRTHTQRLAHFLKFPATMAEPLKVEEEKKQQTVRHEAASTPQFVPPPPPPPKITFPTAAKPTPSPEAPNRVVTPPPAATAANPDAETRVGWNMQSFDDIGDLADEEPAEPLLASADDDDDDENFSEFRIQTPAARGYTGPGVARESADTNSNVPSLNTEEGEEPWSHQDLARFKLDLPPVTASNPELGIELEISDENEGLPRTPRPFISPQSNPEATTATGDRTSFGLSDFSSNTEARSFAGMGNRTQSHNDLLLGADEIASSSNEIGPDLALEEDLHSAGFEIAVPSENEDATFITRSQPAAKRSFDANLGTDDFPADEVGKIPQLSSERLEQIIRAQSREIIEGVVRKIVPDLASDIIREELQRLLEDTAVRERR